MKKVYLRFIKSNGITIGQLVFFKWVIGYSINKSSFNGGQGIELHLKRRINTTL